MPHSRAGKITHHTWELVIGHTDAGIVVQPADEPPSEISIRLLERHAIGGIFWQQSFCVRGVRCRPSVPGWIGVWVVAGWEGSRDGCVRRLPLRWVLNLSVSLFICLASETSDADEHSTAAGESTVTYNLPQSPGFDGFTWGQGAGTWRAAAR